MLEVNKTKTPPPLASGEPHQKLYFPGRSKTWLLYFHRNSLHIRIILLQSQRLSLLSRPRCAPLPIGRERGTAMSTHSARQVTMMYILHSPLGTKQTASHQELPL